MSRSVDARVIGDGTIFLVRPTSEAAADWLRDNVSEDATWFGGAIAVEHRFIDDLVIGMRDVGLVVVAGSTAR